MIDALTGWAMTHFLEPNVLLHTTDGGTHWINVTPRSGSGQQVDVYRVTALTSLIAWVPAEATLETSQIFHTLDGGQTWKSVTFPGQSGPFHFINVRQGWMLANEGPAMGSEVVDIYRSTDGGDTWIKVSGTESYPHEGYPPSGLPFGGSKGDITFLSKTTGWIEGYIISHDWTYLFVTHDGGRTWRHQKLPLPPGVTAHFDSMITPPTFFNARDGVLPVKYTNLNPSSDEETSAMVVSYITHDGGTSWLYTTALSAPHWDRSPSSFIDVNHGWVTDGDTLYVTSNEGHQWTPIRSAGSFVDVKQIDFVSPREGWAVSKIFPYLLKTLDGGQTWVPVMYTISGQ